MRPFAVPALLILLASCSSASGQRVRPPEPNQRTFDYPATQRGNTVDVIHGQRVADPYRWLEDGTQQRVKTWVTHQDKFARDYVRALPLRDAYKKRLTELSYYDAISAPRRYGDKYFYSRKHKTKEKSVVYWRQGKDGPEQTLIDPNTLSRDGSISLGGWQPSHNGEYVAYRLKKNNADHAILYVMTVQTGTTSQQDVIEGARYAYPSWTPDNRGFFYTRLPMDKKIPIADLPGHAHVRYHRLGTDPSDDPIYYKATGDPKTFVSAEASRDGKYLIVSISHGWTSTDVWVKELSASHGEPGTGYKPLAVGIQARFHVAAWQDYFYIHTDMDAPRYRLLRTRSTELARDRWQQVVPQSDATLRGFNIVGNHLALTYMRNASSELEVRTLPGALVRKVTLPGIGSSAGLRGNENDDEAYFSFSSYTQAPQIYKTSVQTGDTKLWAQVELPVDTSHMKVEQVWYPSKDGTKISMFIVRRTDTPLNGQNRVILFGYGGFNQSLTPSFSTSIVTWLEKGGIYAVANLRGGGEYGEQWHEAGMLLRKQNVFDDFIYAAKYLSASGYTSPRHIGIYGASNGGLLVGAAMVQQPALFGAVVCSVPLLDMIRYHQFGSGKTWISEYGSAQDKRQFAALHAYSPYHRVVKGTRYPAMLMLAADADDRVDPMHARKFTAAIQWASASARPAIMRVETNSGHSGADLVKQRVERNADLYAFLHHELSN